MSLTNTLPFCKIWLYGKVQLTFWYYRKLFLKCSSNQSSLHLGTFVKWKLTIWKFAQEKFVLNVRHVYIFYSTIKYFDFIIFISMEIIHWYLCHSSRVAKSEIGFVVFCRSLFVLLSCFFLTLYCLPFFNLRLLITSLVSPSVSHMSLPPIAKWISPY